MEAHLVSVRLEDVVGQLRFAQDFKGPFVLTIDGTRTIVSREQFLNFYIDVAVEDLWNLKESIDESSKKVLR